MLKSELNEIIDAATSKVLEKNKENIESDIRRMFKSDSEDEKISAIDAAIRGTALCLTLLPSLSAAITARLLIDLGLVTLEDDD